MNASLDSGFICIDAGDLPLEKVTYKNREKYALIARIISGQILLPKKDQCYISESE